MRIAIIGAGNVGSALSAATVRAGHAVSISATSPDKASAVAAATGAHAARDNAAAVADAEVVVPAVPGNAVEAVARELAPALPGKIVIDATNPLNATYTDLDIAETAAAQSLQRSLPGVPVVKAFNTVFAGRLGTPVEGDLRLTGFYAGDDAEAKRTVAELLASLGFSPVDAGGLRMARALEEMAFLNISLNAGNGWAWQTGWALLGPTS
ncbi:NADPH-dependent F420 reductase [Streptomyces clavifer]|uniref:NADPH-dependent F420 reductase n=1 Tax=Streptomyces clavifer TaxID=68188 RepID=UPI001996F034|nr:prephenate dehydrogenase/arogenate dehydrogenase family protein [Streptomyces clavifer]GHB17849.1 NADPH-dependent F420 reductase [Streptomyces clavifer]